MTAEDDLSAMGSLVIRRDLTGFNVRLLVLAVLIVQMALVAPRVGVPWWLAVGGAALLFCLAILLLILPASVTATEDRVSLRLPFRTTHVARSAIVGAAIMKVPYVRVPGATPRALSLMDEDGNTLMRVTNGVFLDDDLEELAHFLFGEPSGYLDAGQTLQPPLPRYPRAVIRAKRSFRRSQRLQAGLTRLRWFVLGATALILAIGWLSKHV